MTDDQKPLIIKDFHKAMADGPHLGHALMRNIDVAEYPGAMKVQKQFTQYILSCVQLTFTVDHTTGICTTAGGASLLTASEIARGVTYNGAAVSFTQSGGALPTGLSAGTVYFLIYLSNSTFKIATTVANAQSATALTMSDNGSGTLTVVPVPIGNVKFLTRDYKSNFYFGLDSNGRTWMTTTIGTAPTSFYLMCNAALDSGTGNLTNASGNGMSLFQVSDASKTYLFVARDHLLDVAEVTTSSNTEAPSWSNAWQTLNTIAAGNPPHEMLLGEDNITYFVDGRYVGSIVEVAGSVFLPSSSVTYVFNNQALTCPQNESLQCLSEIGTTLLAGGGTYNKIYPWDRVSPSFSITLKVPEVGVYKMKNLGNIVYILAGSKGNVYTTQGTYVKFFKKIPEYVSNGANNIASPVTWGGIGASAGQLLFGAALQISANSGVFRLYTDGRLVIDNQPEEGAQQVYSVFALDDLTYLIGYAGGISGLNGSIKTGYAAVYQSALYKVGDHTKKAAYSQVEVQLATPATSGNIRIRFRRDKISAFGDFTPVVQFTADSTTTAFSMDVGVTDIENIEIQAEFDGQMEPVEIRLYP